MSKIYFFGTIMNQEIYKSIKNLPALDDTVIEIQKICQNEDSSMQELVAVINKDPMLTANILKTANSPLYGFSKEITDVGRAISLFGMATIRGFVLKEAIKKSFSIDLSPYNIANSTFLKIVEFQSALMFGWYTQINANMLKILSPASFMMEIGDIIIARELIKNNLADEFKTKITKVQDLDELCGIELEFIQATSQEVTAQIFRHWRLEEEMVESIFHSQNPNKADENIKPLAKALKIVKTAVNPLGILSDKNMEVALRLIDAYGFEQNQFTTITQTLKP